jgi:type II secretory pathway component PulM
MKEFWSRLTAAFGNLAARERMLVLSAGGLTLITILYFAVIVPAAAIGARAADRLDGAETNYEVMKRLRADYDDVQRRLTSVEGRIRRGSRSNLRTVLESMAQKSQVTVESMEPQAAPTIAPYRETKVEVGLKGVTLPQTISYLHAIESSTDLLSVKNLRIRSRTDKPQLLDVTFTVSSFERI